MTIVYVKKKFPPPPFDEEVAEIHYYRHLYEGNHEEIFPRAKMIPTTDKVYKRRRNGRRGFKLEAEEVSTSNVYVVANFSSLVAEVPADLINRSLGNISADSEDEPSEGEITEPANELDLVTLIVKASKPNDKIWAAVTQHQADGRIAYRVRRNDQGKLWFEWILGDQFFPHDDGMGADIAWIEEREDSRQNKHKYLRVERQRLEENMLTTKQLVFAMDGDSVVEELGIEDYASTWDITVPEDLELQDVDELMCGLVPNEETLLKPRGRSALRNVAGIQEEINWTITRDSIVFEKHGKPKLAIPRALWENVANNNQRNYGGRFVRNADLEVVSYDEKTGAIPQYITWDAHLERSFEHVRRLIEFMLAISKTSAQAAGLEEGRGETGVALLYLWIQSVIKAESIKDKFDPAIKAAIRKCIILENALGGKDFEVKDPIIEWGDMLPKAESERDTEEADKYDKGVQSLETTIRRMHPDWSEKAIEEEVKKIQEEKAADTMNPNLNQPPRVTLE